MKGVKDEAYYKEVSYSYFINSYGDVDRRGGTIEISEAATTLNNPRVVKDASMESRQRVTWDCVYFGSYPQVEVVCETDSDAIDNLEKMDDNFGAEYIKVNQSIWSDIVNADYDNNGDAVVGEKKYHRIKKADATFGAQDLSNYYNWTDSITYHYFQYEPIKWRVLNVDGDDAFLLADRTLDVQRYNNSSVDITWEKSSIRNWLNDKFLHVAFTSNEQQQIKTTLLNNKNSKKFGTAGGNDTEDKVFLLSESETYDTDIGAKGLNGFTGNSDYNDEGRRSKGSTYAKAMGAWSKASEPNTGYGYWWLRSPGKNTYTATIILMSGYVFRDGYHSQSTDVGVRPALHLELSTNRYSYAGTVCSDGTENEEHIHNLKKVDQVNADCENNGQKEHWECETCHKLFSDDAGKKIVAAEDLVIPATGHIAGPESKIEPTFFQEGKCIVRCKNCKVIMKEETLTYSSNKLRLAGDDRYITAQAVADALKQSLGVDKFSDIIVADGNNYPDALAGSYLAKVKKAPLILVDRSVASEKMIGEYIEKNLSDKGTVYLLGGSDVVTERFEKSLKGTDVKRLAGDTRYETNLEILNEAKASKEDLLVCTGEGFADSLSASAVGKPILLVDNRGLTKAQKTYLDKANVQDIYLIGGADVVSDKVGKELKTYDTDSKTERIAGDNRYKTSVAVAKAFFPDKCDTAVLAYGMKFPDGLAGGPLAISMGSPLLLVEDTAYADAKAYGSSVGVSRLAVLGGTDVISDATAKRILQ